MVEFGEALSVAGKIGHQDLISKAHHNIGISFHLQRDYNQALEHYRQSLAIRDKLNDREGIADTRHNISITQAERGHFSGAVEFAEPAGALAKQIGKRELIWRIYTTLGRVRLALNQPDKAKEAFDEAIKAIEEMRANVAGGEQQLQAFFENKTAPYIGQVDLLLAQGRKEEALGYAERAKGRALLNVLQGGKVNVAAAMTPAQQERELGLKNEIAAFNTKLYQERMRQRPDEKRLAELDGKLRQAQLGYEKFQVELYAAHPELKIKRGESPPLTLAEAGVLLPDNRTVLLSFVAAEEKTLLFLLTRPAATSAPQLDVYSLPVKREEIAERIGKFRQALAGNKPGFGKEARALHDLLLGRAQPQLRGKDKFVIVPDGALWELPFQALMTGGGRYLWQEGAIAYAPSLTVLREMAKARRERSNRSAATLLAIGDPALGKEVIERQKTLMGKTLEQMPEAVQQVQSLKQLYGPKRSKVFIRAEATEAQVKAEAARHGILHLAAHGVLNDRSPMYSHIVLAQTAGDAKIGEEGGEQGQEEDGLLEAWELMKMDLQADLAVLSACETARGRVSAGEGMIGLTWALFVAGVPTTVVSQWSVRSDSTARLMVEFHRQLRRSPAAGKNSSAPVTKAEALRNAALTLMKDASYGHPFHWAGFVVMGDGFDGDVKNAEDKSKIVRRDK
jgi:CHAT domain-containing protein